MKPWRECASDEERLDVYNGLLLSALWDAAFDRYLVTFREDGFPAFSPRLSAPARARLEEEGRSIGLRDHGGFLAMIAAGHIPARQALNAKTRRLQYWVSAEDIAAFHRRFVTITTLSSETGLHRNSVRGLLAASRVTPFAPRGQEFGPVYLRAEALRALKSG